MPPRARVDVARVRELLAQGVRQKDICERLGVSTTTVSEIANGRYPATGKPARSVAAPTASAITEEV